MKRALFRFFGLLSFAAMICCGIVDLLASSGQVATIFRPLGAHWLSLHEASLNAIHASLTADGASAIWGGFLLPILSQPAIVVFGCLAVLFLALALLSPRGDWRRSLNHDDDPRYDRRRS